MRGKGGEYLRTVMVVVHSREHKVAAKSINPLAVGLKGVAGAGHSGIHTPFYYENMFMSRTVPLNGVCSRVRVRKGTLQREACNHVHVL